MIYNHKKEQCFCNGCHCWLSLRKQCYSAGGQLRCLEHDHTVGYEHDVPEIYSGSPTPIDR